MTRPSEVRRSCPREPGPPPERGGLGIDTCFGSTFVIASVRGPGTLGETGGPPIAPSRAAAATGLIALAGTRGMGGSPAESGGRGSGACPGSNSGIATVGPPIFFTLGDDGGGMGIGIGIGAAALDDGGGGGGSGPSGTRGAVAAEGGSGMVAGSGRVGPAADAADGGATSVGR